MEGLLPSPTIRPLASEHFVGLAADADAPEPPIIELASTHLADAMMLPLVMFLDSDGSYLGGTHGMVPPDALKAALTDLAS